MYQPLNCENNKHQIILKFKDSDDKAINEQSISISNPYRYDMYMNIAGQPYKFDVIPTITDRTCDTSRYQSLPIGYIATKNADIKTIEFSQTNNQVKVKNIKLTWFEVPSDPGDKDYDTLKGVDVNNNEIRDDVERKQIIQEFKDRPLVLKLRQYNVIRKQRTMLQDLTQNISAFMIWEDHIGSKEVRCEGYIEKYDTRHIYPVGLSNSYQRGSTITKVRLKEPDNIPSLDLSHLESCQSLGIIQ